MTRLAARLATLAAVFALGLVAFTPRVAYAQKAGSKDKPPDEVFLKNGDSKKGKVVKETPRELHLEVGSKVQQFGWKEILRVDYGGTPAEIMPSSVVGAEALIARRDYNRAQREADDAIRDCGGSDRQKLLFLPRARLALARAYLGQGKFQEAAKAAEEASAEGESRYAPAACAVRVEALAQAMDDSVEKVAKETQEKAGENFLLPDGAPAIELADMAFAGYYERKGKTLEAKTIYAKYEGSERPHIRERASLGRARVAIAEKQFDFAKKIFERLASEAKDPDAIAGAMVGLGDAELNAARSASAKDKPVAFRKALNLYLRAAVLAAPTGTGSAENHENSLRRGGNCAEEIFKLLPTGKPESKEERARKFFADYARKLYEELVQTYPNAKDVEALKEQAKKLRAITKQDDDKDDDKK